MNYYNNRGRGNFLANLPQVTKSLLIMNVVVFLIDMVTNHLILRLMALYSIHTGYFEPYQIVTHMFLHGNFSHLFMNMFGLFMFGRALEHTLGSKKFFILYIVSGLGAAGIQLGMYYMNGIAVPMVGASGAIFGIITAFALYYPNVEFMLIFFPVPIKAKYFVPIYAVIELFLGVANFQMDNVAHFAHLGGAVFGFFLARYWKKNQFRQF